LVSEILVAALAEAIGLRVPRRALIFIDAGLVSENRDPELLELLEASHGLNVGLEVLEGARDLRPEDVGSISNDDASIVMWLDWIVMNPDRTPGNPNILIRKNELWLIDHGAALVFHHNWSTVTEDSPCRPWFPPSLHALRHRAARLKEWDAVLSVALNNDLIKSAVQEVPDEFLRPLVPLGARPDAVARRREAYSAFLWKRVKSPRQFT
jgi:hypothetical protein